MTSFVLVNNCSDPELTPAMLAQIAAALEIQANRDVATHWGGDVRVRAATPDNPPTDVDVTCAIVDEYPDEPSAVAFHNWQGHAQIYAARGMCSSLTGGSLSLSQALSHEIIETMIDESCAEWLDDGTGSEVAKEACDPVEQGWYRVNEIAVSDFVLPAWFEVGALGPYAFVQLQHGDTAPAAPFSIAPGGYAIKRSASTDEHQVEGVELMTIGPPTVTVSISVPFGRRAPKKRHWSSRTFRRGARV